MATAAGSDDSINNSENDSLTKESDEMLEMYCEHCDKEKAITVKADGFCEDCLEYLCSTCLWYHKKYKSDHTTKDSAKMPQDFCFLKCENHKDELIKFYCKSCNQKACTLCKTDRHLECTIEHLPSYVGSIDLKSEVRNMIETIDSNLEIIKDSKKEIYSKHSKVKEFNETAKKLVEDHYRKLQNITEDLYNSCACKLKRKHQKERECFEKKKADVLAKLEKENRDLINKHHFENKKLHEDIALTIEQLETKKRRQVEKSDKFRQEDELKLTKKLSKAEKPEADLETMKQKINTKMKANQNCEALLAVKEAKTQIEKIETDMEEISQCCEIKYYEFLSINEEICELNSDISFGYLEERSKIKRSISHLHDITINLPTNQKSSCITGLCKIADGYLIVADNANASIKMIDIERKIISMEITMEDKPFEITPTENNTVATTLPKAKKIQLLTVMDHNQVSLHSQIQVQGECYGIAFNKPNIIVGYHGKMQVLDKNGTVLNTIKKIEGILKHIKFHPNEKGYYILVVRPNQSHVLKICVEIKAIQNSSSFVSLANDQAGTLFTYSKDGNAIIQMSSDLLTKHIHKLDDMGLTSFSKKYFSCSAKGLFYCDKENILYMSHKCGIISVMRVR